MASETYADKVKALKPTYGHGPDVFRDTHERGYYLARADASAIAAAADSEIARLTAENERLKEAEVFVNTWGAKLFEGMGKFMADAVQANGPTSAKILCRFPDTPETPVLHLWASTDGQSPVARNMYLREQLSDRDYQIVKLQVELDAARAALAASAETAEGGKSHE